MNLYYNRDAYGSGKTWEQLVGIAARPGKYVVVIDRIEEFKTRKNLILDAAEACGASVVVHSISYKEGDLVTRRFAYVPHDWGHLPHVVVLITHEALKMVDHSVMAGQGWEIIIDEDPKLWKSETWEVTASLAHWRQTYNLQPMIPGYSTISVKPDGPSYRDVAADYAVRATAPFHARVKNSQVVVNLSGEGDDPWVELADRKSLSWFLIWNPLELRHYDRATILAASFDQLVSFKLITAMFPTVQMIPINTGSRRQWQQRAVTINYVAEQHRAGNHFFQNTPEGQRAVAAWAAWVKRSINADSHFWATNKSRGGLGLPGQQISPKVAGTNRYRELTEVSILYSAKANRWENSVFETLTDGLIDADTIMRDREYEDLIQIVFRSSLREPEDQRPVTINVYDGDQARFLEGSFAAAGFPFTTRVVHHDIGIDGERAQPGRKANPDKPPLTSAERAAAYRRRRAEAKAAAEVTQ